MRINPSDQTPASGPLPLTTVDKSRADFGAVLSKSQKLQQSQLSAFLTQLDQQGKKLVETMSAKDLFKFKNMIRTFLQSTFGQSRQMQEESLWDFRGHPRVMARVAKINQALEDLGHEVLKAQAEPMQILEKIGEIRGLILDLFA